MTAILVLAVVACFMTNPRQSKESTAQGSNYIDLNQPPILDVIQMDKLFRIEVVAKIGNVK